MTRQGAPPDSIRARLGTLLQRRREDRGLSQRQLAKLTNLSLKYIGEVERGDANLTMKTFERIAAALDWDPLEPLTREHQFLPDDLRTPLASHLDYLSELVQKARDWLQTFDMIVARRLARGPVSVEGGTGSERPLEVRRRGRPRKPRPANTYSEL